jgi:hypothetical protein
MPVNSDLDKSSLARLAFWSANMSMIAGARMSWPGFSYTEPEAARMSTLAEAVEPAAFVRFLLVTTAVFIVLAALAIVGIFVPILSALYPNPADMQPLPFVLLLASTALLAIGIGLPVSMRVAALASTNDAMRAGLSAQPGDAELAAKVAFQLTRMTVIMCGLLVPGVLLWIAFDIKGGPIVTALKWIAVGLMAVSMAHTVVARRKG